MTLGELEIGVLGVRLEPTSVAARRPTSAGLEAVADTRVMQEDDAAKAAQGAHHESESREVEWLRGFKPLQGHSFEEVEICGPQYIRIRMKIPNGRSHECYVHLTDVFDFWARDGGELSTSEKVAAKQAEAERDESQRQRREAQKTAAVDAIMRQVNRLRNL